MLRHHSALWTAFGRAHYSRTCKSRGILGSHRDGCEGKIHQIAMTNTGITRRDRPLKDSECAISSTYQFWPCSSLHHFTKLVIFWLFFSVFSKFQQRKHHYFHSAQFSFSFIFTALFFSFIFVSFLAVAVFLCISSALRSETRVLPGTTKALRTSILSVFHNIQFLTATSYNEIYKILLRFLPLQSTLSVLPNIIGRHGLPVWRSWMLQL